MPQKKYLVTLTAEERQHLTKLLSAGKRSVCPLRNLGAFGTDNWCRKSPPQEPDDCPPVPCWHSRRPAVLLGTPGSAIASTLAALYACHPRPVNGYDQALPGGAIGPRQRPPERVGKSPLTATEAAQI
jgi:hypothetical protein